MLMGSAGCWLSPVGDVATMGGGVDAGVLPTLKRLLEENQADLSELESWRSQLSG